MHPIVSKIRLFLDEGKIKYTFIEHEEAISSEDAFYVRKNHTLSEGCKALIVKIDTGFIQIVIPGDKKFLNSSVRTLCNTKNVRFAKPKELEEITEGIQPGGIPPFGNLLGLKVFVDKKVFDNKQIVFNCGIRTASISMKSEDYKNIVKPIIADISA